MHLSTLLATAITAATTISAKPSTQKVAAYARDVPSLTVCACPEVATITYSQSVPDRTPFPDTEVGLCYDDTVGKLYINFTAYGEEYFYYDPTMVTNDPIYEYEVMETFISRGTVDPQTYLEFEINPGNVTWQAVVYNPSKVRAADSAFSPFMIEDPLMDGFAAATTVDEPAQTWSSQVQIPLGLFNVDPGTAKGTEWRMNFFRIIVSEDTYPNQTLGSWSPPDEASFHMTPFFGHVTFE
ncbi:hypothetical protein AB5N19_01766 [Seiridium cardinale]|uniref:Carbohydrate-binding domain-containing protein n=1 Tax=Seiridium cardinale TaxID=138064 RepID=A0ABR2XB82_9PEZI